MLCFKCLGLFLIHFQPNVYKLYLYFWACRPDTAKLVFQFDLTHFYLFIIASGLIVLELASEQDQCLIWHSLFLLRLFCYIYSCMITQAQYSVSFPTLQSVLDLG